MEMYLKQMIDSAIVEYNRQNKEHPKVIIMDNKSQMVFTRQLNESRRRQGFKERTEFINMYADIPVKEDMNSCFRVELI